MKRIIIATLLLALGGLVKAQIKAVTESGDEVILLQDGTWKYVNDSLSREGQNKIMVNKKEFLKDKKSTFLVKCKKLNIGIWIDPKEWSLSKNSNNEAAEYEFQKKGEDLYGMLISEKMQIPIESLKEIALTNARGAAPDLRVVKEEYRIVNGIKVLMMQLSGTIRGIKFTYFGYYYSNSNGTIQFITYTGSSLFENYMSNMETFLNGLVEL